FAKFQQSVRDADEATASKAFAEIFRRLKGQDFKRWYFMHLIDNAFSNFALPAQKGMCVGMAANSETWQTDAFELSTAVTCTRQTLLNMSGIASRGEFLRQIVEHASSDLYAVILYWRLRKLEEEEGGGTKEAIDIMMQPLEAQLRTRYLRDSAPSVFDQYGPLSLSRIDPIQF